ncbi:MAG TPA: hypothetical protein VIL48_05090 [Acidimicrobiales bacterium]
MPTSSANPQKLSRYSSDGLAMVERLRTKSNSVTSAIESLSSSRSRHLPSLGDAHTRFADLVGDWQHLDEFAGDVANAFYNADRNGNPGRNYDMVMTLSDSVIMANGHVGYADRDVAIAEAERLARDMQRTMEDGRVSREEMEAFAARAQRGMYDPAFSVSFAETMGPDGMAGIPAMIERAWPDGDRGRNPDWGRTQLLPFATVLTTAMDTRRANEQIDLHDPDNANLADEDRLSEEWVDDFVDFWQPDDFQQPNNLHYSLLVRYADLPADVLVDIGNRQLDYMLAHDATPTSYMNGFPWGPEDSTAEINILTALGNNQDASALWLSDTNPGDGTLGYPGRTCTNMELLLRYNPTIGGATDNPLLANALDRVVDNGLQHWDEDLSDPLFETVIDTVADEGAVHFDALVPTLGEGARTHIDQLANRTNEVLPENAGQPDANALRPLHNAHDFLRVIMADDEAATSVYRGSLEYVRDQLRGDTGDGLGGESRRIGALMGLVTEADENAAVQATQERIAARQSFLDGVGLASDVIGLVPIAGNAAHAVNVSTFLLDQAIDNFGMAGLPDGPDQDYANIENVRAGLRAHMTDALATYEYASNPEWTSSSVTETARNALAEQGLDVEGMDVDFFVDGTEGDRRPIKPYAEMSESERRAYNAWLNSDPVSDAIAGDRTAAGQRMDEVTEALEHR